MSLQVFVSGEVTAVSEMYPLNCGQVSASRKIADLNAELREANAARDSAEKRQRVSAVRSCDAQPEAKIAKRTSLILRPPLCPFLGI